MPNTALELTTDKYGGSSTHPNIGAVGFDFSIEFWFKPYTGHYGVVAQKGGSGDPRPFDIYYYGIGGYNLMSLFRMDYSSHMQYLQTTDTVVIGAWNYYCWTIDWVGGFCHIYRNGIIDERAGPYVTGALSDSSNPYVVAYGYDMRAAPYALDLNGCIDEFRIWNRVLDSTEIANNYNAGKGRYGVDTTNLIQGYHFNDVNPIQTYDYSGGGYHMGISDNRVGSTVCLEGSGNSAFVGFVV